jgi:Polyketide cyclase / dehydrase and lipid transport
LGVARGKRPTLNTAMDVTATLIFKATPEAAASVMFDYTREAEWLGVSRTKLLSAPPLHVGSRIKREGVLFGRGRSWVSEVKVIEPMRRVMRIMDGPFFGGEVTYLVGPFQDGARVSIRHHGPARVINPFIGVLVRGAMRRNLRRLKRLVQGDAR